MKLLALRAREPKGHSTRKRLSVVGFEVVTPVVLKGPSGI
jgi:hypothetical protein